VITFRPQPKFDKESAVILLTSDMVKHSQFGSLSANIKKNIEVTVKAKQFAAETGQMFPLVLDKSICLLIGLGKKDELTLTSLRIQLKKAFCSAYLSKIKNVEIIPHQAEEVSINAIIEGILIGTYSWKKYRSLPKNDESIDEKNIFIAAAKKDSFERTITICAGMRLTRDLINDNADVVHSEYIEKTVRSLLKGRKEVKFELLGRREMTKKGLGFHLAVNQGSRYEPKLMIVKYTGNPKSKEYTALVGKGMTFDTGGLNLKPTNGIETMRTDMSGAAAVIGTLKNTLALKLKKNIIFAVGVAENAIDALAYKPGDVIRGYAGKTAEIGNTDAEGRLVLSDVMDVAAKKTGADEPEYLIDIATLTGAIKVALGGDTAGLFCNDDKLANSIIAAGQRSGEPSWRMPLIQKMWGDLSSQFADFKNSGGGFGGAITAALFLQKFTNGKKWAHLDVYCWTDKSTGALSGGSATGQPVQSVIEWLESV